MAAEKAAEKTRADIVSRGFLSFGDRDYDGETSVMVNGASIFELEVSSVQEGIQFARIIEENHGKAMVKQYETAVDGETGQEVFITVDKSFGSELCLPCKGFAYTDPNGIILPWAEVHQRMGLGLDMHTQSVSVCESVEGSYTDADKVEVSYRPGNGVRKNASYVGALVYMAHTDRDGYFDLPVQVKKPAVHKWAFDAAPSNAVLRFNKLLSQKRPSVDVDKIRANALAVDRNRLQKMWARVVAIAATRKECVETEIPLPESPGYKPLGPSPVKVMTYKDRLAATRRRYKGFKKTPVCPQKLAAKKACKQTIENAQAKLAEIKTELETLVSGRLVAVPFRRNEARIERSEVLIKGLKAMAQHQRAIIREEREELVYLEKGDR